MDKVGAQTELASTVADDVLLLRREDLFALGAAYLSHGGDSRQWGAVAAAVGGFALGPVLMMVGSQLGWSSRLDPVFFFGGWAVLLTIGAFVWRRERKMRRLYELRCPACEDFLLNGVPNREGIPPLVELIVATGTCPHCRAQILAS